MISYFDLVLVLLLGGSGAWSAWRGLIREVFALLALLAGVLVATACYGLLMPRLESWFGAGLLARVVAFALLFGAAALVVVLLGYGLQKVVKVMLLGWLDRAGGFAIGVVKAGFILGVVLMMLDKIGTVHEYLADKSALAPGLLALTRGAFALIPRLFARFAGDFA